MHRLSCLPLIIGIFWTVVFALPIQAQNETLTKTAVPSASAAGNALTDERVDWVLSYEPGATGVFTIEDLLPPGLIYEPGSLRVPPGWTKKLSADPGFTIEVQGNATSSVVTSSSQLIPFPTISSDFGAFSGDGTIPILVNDRVYALHHHQAADAASLSCRDRATAVTCAGYPYTFSTAVGPASAPGMGNGDVWTLLFQEEYPILGDRLYYGAQTETSYGIGCFDLASEANCGYVQLAGVPQSQGSFPAAFSMKQVGDRIFTVDINHDVACFDLNTLAACPGYPVSVGGAAEGLTPFDPSLNAQGGPTIFIEEIDGRLIYVMNHSFFSLPGTSAYGRPAEISCFDTLTGQRCAGWTSISATSFAVTNGALPGGGIADIIKRRSTSGTTAGFCTLGNRDVLGVNPGVLVECYDLSGAVIPSPAGLGSSWIPTALSLIAHEIGDRIYLPVIHNFGGANPGYTGATQCWDWSIDGPCPGFGVNGFRPWTDINGGDTLDYGYASDGTCLYGLGDSGFLWTFNPEDGTAPCAGALLDLELDSQQYYCDGLVHNPGWTTFDILDADLGVGAEFSSLSLEILDESGASLFGPSDLLASSGQVDLSAIGSLSTQSKLRFLVTGAAQGSLPWDDLVAPRAEVQFAGDPAQVCFTTRVANDCALDNTTLTNTARTLPGGTSTSYSLSISATGSCVDGGDGGSDEPKAVPIMPVHALASLILLLTLLGVWRIGGSRSRISGTDHD